MPNTFYYDACNVDARMTPFPPKLKNMEPDKEGGLDFFVANEEGDGKLMSPHSIMNDHVAINYRTIYNGYNMFQVQQLILLLHLVYPILLFLLINVIKFFKIIDFIPNILYMQ